ncbi:vomeronasal type 1 receptor A1, partial [Sigmodon hispidus]
MAQEEENFLSMLEFQLQRAGIPEPRMLRISLSVGVLCTCVTVVSEETVNMWFYRETFFVGVMVLFSGYMVALLCRHKKQSQHLHNTRLSPKASPEQRATRTILLLMGFFVILVSHSYASVSPFVFISTEKDIIGRLSGCCDQSSVFDVMAKMLIFSVGDGEINQPESSLQRLSGTKMDRNSRLHSNSNLRNTFFSEIGIAILGNSILLLFHILKFLCGHRPKPTDLPIGLLALIHLLMLLIMAFIATDLFISWRGWDDITCKILVYLYRICRGLSLCTTSMLSVLQAIILSPRSSCLAKFKNKSPHHISCALLFLGIFYMFISSHLLLSIIATPNLTLNNILYVTESCSVLRMSYLVQSTFTTLLAIREAFLISVMVLSSGYMVDFLCRHKKQSQHLHNTSLSPKVSPEQRAIWTILLLLSFFVMMSILDGIFSCSRTMFLDEPTSYNIQHFVMHVYATISPFVFMCTEKHVGNLLRSMCLDWKQDQD